MLEPVALAGMIFSLLVILLIGGFILLYPLSRRLGALLEQRLSASPPPANREVAQLSDAVRALQAEVQRIGERQAFTESLLEEQRPRELAGVAAEE
ncbi:hypothetical protein BH23GEM4_BH23GEM4_23610 [soil metagenome]